MNATALLAGTRLPPYMSATARETPFVLFHRFHKPSRLRDESLHARPSNSTPSGASSAFEGTCHRGSHTFASRQAAPAWDHVLSLWRSTHALFACPACYLLFRPHARMIRASCLKCALQSRISMAYHNDHIHIQIHTLPGVLWGRWERRMSHVAAKTNCAGDPPSPGRPQP